MRKSKAEKETDRRIDAAYRESCSGIQINMLDIPKIFVEGRKFLAEGADDASLKEKIRSYVETIRCN